MRYNNQLVLTGKINDVGEYTRTNIPDSYRAGVELQGTVVFTPWLSAGGNLTLSSNKVKNLVEFVDDYDNGGQKTVVHQKTDIAFSPDVVGSGTLNIVPFRKAAITLLSKYVGRQYLDNTGNAARSLADYYVQDARLLYTFNARVLKQTGIILQVNNIFNRKYEPNGYTYSYINAGHVQNENYVFPMAGINWMLGVNISL